MTYNVFSGTLNPTQSQSQPTNRLRVHLQKTSVDFLPIFEHMTCRISASH